MYFANRLAYGFVLVSALILSACGSSRNSSNNSGKQESVFDYDERVMDGTGITAISRSELTKAIEKSAVLADLALGRLFDFETSRSNEGFAPVTAEAAVFCDGETEIINAVSVSGARLEIRYEADVTSCVNQNPSDGAGSIKVARSQVGFALTFVCSTKDVTKLAELGSARAILEMTDSLVCKTSPVGATTGRSYRYAAIVEGQYVGPRSEVPIKQKFWRGYDSGGTGEPCLLSRDPAGAERLGRCVFHERSESENLVDQSRSIKLLTAEALPRTRNGSLFDDGALRVGMNGWLADTSFAPEDSEITMNFSGPAAACARFSVRPGWVNFRASECLAGDQ